MICASLLQRVAVYRDYQLEVEFTITLEQFLHGLDSVSPVDQTEALPAAKQA